MITCIKYIALQHEQAYLLERKKCEQLRQRHGIGFEEITIALDRGKVITDDRPHTSSEYSHQRQLIIEIENYAYIVPYVENEDYVFLAMLYPSRVMTKKYLTNLSKP